MTATGGGTLELANTVTNIGMLQVNSGSRLKLDAASSAATTIVMAPAAGSPAILEVVSALTVTNPLAVVGAATLQLDPGSTLTDTMGVALVGGTITGAGTLAGNTNLYGYGTVDINIATVGTIVAIAGRLEPDRKIGPQGDGQRPQLDDRRPERAEPLPQPDASRYLADRRHGDDAERDRDQQRPADIGVSGRAAS